MGLGAATRLGLGVCLPRVHRGSALARRGSIVVEVSDQGSDLRMSWSGTFDLTGYTSSGTGGPGGNYAQIDTFAASQFDLFFEVSSSYDTYTKANTSVAASSIPFTSSSGNTTGSYFRINENITSPGNALIYVPQGYSGGQISGSTLFASTSIAALFGTTLDSGPQTYFSDGTNTLTIQAVPEPTTSAIVVAGGLAVAAATLRRRPGRPA